MVWPVGKMLGNALPVYGAHQELVVGRVGASIGRVGSGAISQADVLGSPEQLVNLVDLLENPFNAPGVFDGIM
jgi:hypothetical protein